MAQAQDTPYSGYTNITETVGISYNTLTQGTGYLYGFYGWGGVLILPLALKFGHRPVYLGTMLVVFAMCIWVPWITTDGQWIASRIIYGTFGSPCESLNEVSISMIYYSHERGYYLGFYTIALYAGAFLAPACSGYLFDAAGLSGVMYFTSGVAALCFFILFFFFEEVSYNQKPEFARVAARANPRITDDKLSASRSNSPHASEKETAAAVFTAVEPLRLGQDRGLIGKNHSYLYTLGMFREVYCTNRQMFDACWRPFYMLVKFPCIFYAGFSLGVSLCIYTVLTGTIGTVLGAPPYSFGSGPIGLVYLGPLLVAFFAGPLTGAIGDRMVIRSARKNQGLREPEARLWINLFNVGIVPPAFVLWGVGAVHGVHWFGLEVALTCIGAFVVVQAAVSCAYILDCYKEMALEVMIAAVLVRNTMGFALGYAVAPWVEGMGVQNMHLSMGFVGAAFSGTFLLFVWKGKWLRAQTKDTFWRLAATTPIKH
ncbi:hypothetical protein JCM10207_008176 [Rhodosporidiobolus poonsookiae]